MAQISGLAGAMARLYSEAAKPAVEYQFNQIQNTTIGRINKEIEQVIQKNDRSDEVTRLEKERGKLAEAIPGIEKYRFQSYGNKLRLDKTYDLVIAAQNTFTNEDDDDSVLTESEAASLNNLKEQIQDKIAELNYVVHQDINRPNALNFLKNKAKELENYTAVAGPVDPSDTAPEDAVNDNRALRDLLNGLLTKTLGAVEEATSTVRTAYEMIDDFRGKITEIDAEFVEVQAVDAARTNQEIQDIKSQYANMLQAISLSFDMQTQYTDYIAKSLHDRSIEPGSVMNLFS